MGTYHHRIQKNSNLKNINSSEKKGYSGLLLLVSVLLLTVPAQAAYTAESGTVPQDAVKYIEGLEALADEKESSAVGVFQDLRAQFPQSPYADKAESYLYYLQNRKNNGGIVPFYLGNLATATYSSMMLPSIFDYELDDVLGGITGLAGVAGGLTSAWLMSRNHPISPDQDWWIESVEAISLGNYLYASAIIDWPEVFDDDYALAGRVNQAGILTTALSSRAAAYTLFRNESPSKGKAAFMIQSYGWANAYYWLFTAGVLELKESRANSIGGMAVSDGALIGSLYAWEQLRWSPLRTGLVTVGGLGGGLLGFFTTMILSEIWKPTGPQLAGVIMGSAAAGQAVTTYLTRNMEPEPDVSFSAAGRFSVFPIVDRDQHAGIQLSFAF